MPRDGGHLVVEPDEYKTVMADPVAARYVHRYVGARELLHNLPRWCLWLVDLDPADVGKSALLKQRLEAVRTFRSKSTATSTVQMANTPHLFGQRSQPTTPFVAIPSVSSESRRFLPVARLSAQTIASNLIFTTPDLDGFLFAVISSSMFMAWQKAVGGRLESRLRFSNTIVWNNLPLPLMPSYARNDIIRAGRIVLEARALHPERSLADHYNPLAMDPVLLRAHAGLDRVVDKAFGARKALSREDERRAVLFARYAELTKDE